MDRRTTKAQGRAAPARKTIIGKMGRYRAMEAAQKRIREARQAVAPDQEQQPGTAVDKVESYSVNAAHEVLNLLPSGKRRTPKPPKKNPFHGETDFWEDAPCRPTPKERMRHKAVKDFKQKRSEQAKNAFHRETHFEDPLPPQPKEQMRRAFVRQLREQKQAARNTPILEEQRTSSQTLPQPLGKTEKRRGMNAPAHKKANEKAARSNQSVLSIHPSTGQRQRTLPRASSSATVSKAQIVKEQGRRYAREQAIREIKTGTARNLSGKAAKASGAFFKRLGTAVTKAVTPSRSALLYAAGALVLIIVPFMVIMGVASMLTGSGEGRSAYIAISAEVEAYRPLIRLYAAQYGIPEYEDLIAAVMMQESGGRGSDPMQASESGYNTRYPHAPNSITDPEYSIDVGVQALAAVFGMAGVESPIDLEHISLALQGYNFGPGYISWALDNYSGYSELNAIEFSDMMAAQMGWTGYGDKAYVSHVLRYYPIGRVFMGEGNTALLAVAQTQLGNVGGAPYWSWWGYHDRVEWCAIFVSWVADQCGYLDAGVLPRMEGVLPYIDWFKARGQWQGQDFAPSPGDIIFFDWEGDGLADHVGIVEKMEDGFVYTIEGNSGDVCAERRYTFGSAPIFGYGLPQFG